MAECEKSNASSLTFASTLLSRSQSVHDNLVSAPVPLTRPLLVTQAKHLLQRLRLKAVSLALEDGLILEQTPSSSSSSCGEFWCSGALINRRSFLTVACHLSEHSKIRHSIDQETIKLSSADLVCYQASQYTLRKGKLEAHHQLSR